MLKRFVRSAFLVSLSLLLLIQGAIPAGYMPARISSGWLVELCPEGLPAAFLAAITPAQSNPHAAAGDHHHHQHHGGHAATAAGEAHSQGHHASSTDYCPLGSALDTPAVVDLPDLLQEEHFNPEFLASRYLPPAIARSFFTSHPRAPPIT